MHGRVKVRTTAEQDAIKKIERAKKVVQYKTAISLVFQKRKDKIYDEELLLITERMLLQNPDINTIWNIRREAFENNDWSPEEYAERLKKELPFTVNCLRENPKSYSAWHHRCWVIDHLPEPDWMGEVELCGKLLELDERNFHCWDYRQHIVKKAGISDEQELEFYTKKILKNFSNYSAWHYRSKLLTKMFPDPAGQWPINFEQHQKELELVMNATFTDPNDSSAWFYQSWLLNYSKSQPNSLWRAIISENRAIVVFHGDTCIKTDNLILIKKQNTTDNQYEEINTWNSYNTKLYSKIWITELPMTFLENSSLSLSLKYENNIYELELNSDGTWFYKSTVTNKYNRERLKEVMENYEQLVEMEPNNKWAILTRIFLRKQIYYDSNTFLTACMEDLESLKANDHKRFNYYLDLRSYHLIDYFLNLHWSKENNINIHSTIELSSILGSDLLYDEHYLALYEDINLSNNFLKNSLHRLAALQNCKKLSLNHNALKSIKKFPTLPKLEHLSLRGNALSNRDELIDLVKRHKLSTLDIGDNDLSVDTTDEIKKVCPDLMVVNV